MKKVIGIFVAAMLVIGIAGPAAAWFEQSSLHFVAYEETDHMSPNDSQAGTQEMHYDLGNSQFDYIMPWLEVMGYTKADLPYGNSWNTGITMSDYDTGSWDDIFIGIYGKYNEHTVLGIAHQPFNVREPASGGFNTFVNYTAYGWLADLSGDPQPLRTVNKIKLTNNSYTKSGLGDTGAGTYSGLIDVDDEPFNAEANLSNGVAGDQIGAIDLYYGDAVHESIWEQMGTMVASLNANNELVLDFTPVPIPGSLLLLGSGLMGLLGIRRRKAA